MSSFLMQAYLLERYGPRLSVVQLAECLAMSKVTIYNKISAGTFPIKSYMEGRDRYFDHRDVAEYLDKQRDQAA